MLKVYTLIRATKWLLSYYRATEQPGNASFYGSHDYFHGCGVETFTRAHDDLIESLEFDLRGLHANGNLRFQVNNIYAK